MSSGNLRETGYYGGDAYGNPGYLISLYMSPQIEPTVRRLAGENFVSEQDIVGGFVYSALENCDITPTYDGYAYIEFPSEGVGAFLHSENNTIKVGLMSLKELNQVVEALQKKRRIDLGWMTISLESNGI